MSALRGAVIGWSLLVIGLSGCKPDHAVGVVKPTPHPSPPARHVAARPTPTPSLLEAVKAEVNTKLPVQAQRWDKATIKPSWQIAVDKAVMLYLRTEQRYKTVEAMRSDGVPAPVIFTLHYRESDASFKCHLHEGSSLLHRTRFVPKGRLPSPDPPYTWETSAEDAIYVCDRLQGDWTKLSDSLDKIERYNGLGYKRMGVPSPYLWSGSTVYMAGKYVADGRYSATAMDQQLGCATILRRMKERGIRIAFSP